MRLWITTLLLSIICQSSLGNPYKDGLMKDTESLWAHAPQLLSPCSSDANSRPPFLPPVRPWLAIVHYGVFQYCNNVTMLEKPVPGRLHTHIKKPMHSSNHQITSVPISKKKKSYTEAWCLIVFLQLPDWWWSWFTIFRFNKSLKRLQHQLLSSTIHYSIHPFGGFLKYRYPQIIDLQMDFPI